MITHHHETTYVVQLSNYPKGALAGQDLIGEEHKLTKNRTDITPVELSKWLDETKHATNLPHVHALTKFVTTREEIVSPA